MSAAGTVSSVTAGVIAVAAVSAGAEGSLPPLSRPGVACVASEGSSVGALKIDWDHYRERLVQLPSTCRTRWQRPARLPRLCTCGPSVRTVAQGRVTHFLDGVDKGWIEHVGLDVEAVNGLKGRQRGRDVLPGYIAHGNRPTVDWVDRARRSWPTRSAREGCSAGRLAVISVCIPSKSIHMPRHPGTPGTETPIYTVAKHTLLRLGNLLLQQLFLFLFFLALSDI